MTGAEIEELFLKSYDQLYVEIFEELPIGFLGAGEPPENDKVRETKNWIDRKRGEICAAIRTDTTVAEHISGKKKDRVTLVAAVADVLATLFALVPVFCLAVLIVRQGIDEFCNLAR